MTDQGFEEIVLITAGGDETTSMTDRLQKRKADVLDKRRDMEAPFMIHPKNGGIPITQTMINAVAKISKGEFNGFFDYAGSILNIHDVPFGDDDDDDDDEELSWDEKVKAKMIANLRDDEDFKKLTPAEKDKKVEQLVNRLVLAKQLHKFHMEKVLPADTRLLTEEHMVGDFLLSIDTPNYKLDNVRFVDLNMEELYNNGRPSPFGDLSNQETRIDEGVRLAREYSPDEFGVLRFRDSKVEKRHKFPNTYALYGMTNELFHIGGLVIKASKLNIYPPGGHFKPHVDTPYDHANSLGTALIVFGQYEGGKLIVGGSEDNEEYEPYTTMHPEKRGLIQLFRCSHVHELTPVTSGYRMSITYTVDLPSKDDDDDDEDDDAFGEKSTNHQNKKQKTVDVDEEVAQNAELVQQTQDFMESTDTMVQAIEPPELDLDITEPIGIVCRGKYTIDQINAHGINILERCDKSMVTLLNEMGYKTSLICIGCNAHAPYGCYKESQAYPAANIFHITMNDFLEATVPKEMLDLETMGYPKTEMDEFIKANDIPFFWIRNFSQWAFEMDNDTDHGAEYTGNEGEPGSLSVCYFHAAIIVQPPEVTNVVEVESTDV